MYVSVYAHVISNYICMNKYKIYVYVYNQYLPPQDQHQAIEEEIGFFHLMLIAMNLLIHSEGHQ